MTIIGIKLQLFGVLISVFSWLPTCEWKRSSVNVSSSLLSQKSLNEDVNMRMRRQKLSVQMTMERFCTASCRIQIRSLCQTPGGKSHLSVTRPTHTLALSVACSIGVIHRPSAVSVSIQIYVICALYPGIALSGAAIIWVRIISEHVWD